MTQEGVQEWHIVSSATLLKDRWINLRADRCRTGDGSEISPYYVLSYPDWVYVVALTREGGIVMVRQYRHGAGVVTLELPGGLMDCNEDGPEAAGRRELVEETGFTAWHWRHVASLHANPATHTNRVHVMLALDAERTAAQRLDPGERGLVVEVLNRKTLLSGLSAGLVGGAIHVAALLLGLEAAGAIALGTR